MDKWINRYTSRDVIIWHNEKNPNIEIVAIGVSDWRDKKTHWSARLTYFDVSRNTIEMATSPFVTSRKAIIAEIAILKNKIYPRLKNEKYRYIPLYETQRLKQKD